MGFNLTNEEIQNTYQQLLQISGSVILDGTGSLAPVLITSASYAVNADFATSASYADTVGNIDTASLVNQTQFNTYTSSVALSTSASFSDVDTQIASLEAGSGSADWPLITNKPAGLVSGSSQTISNLSGTDIVSSSAQTVANLVGESINVVDLTISRDVGTLISSSAFNVGKFGSFVQFIKTDSDGTFNIAMGGGASDTGILMTGSNMTFTGNLTGSNMSLSGNLNVSGTGSFAYLQSVTGSAKIIGDAFIILNNDTPTLRYAGVKVQDSGSTNTTASFFFDGQTNDWNYEYQDGAGTDFGVALFGPEYTTLGTPTYNTNNTLVMSDGGHHLLDSPVSVSASVVTITGVVSASSYIGDGSGLTGISTIIQEGEGGLSIKSVLGSSQTTNGAVSLGLVGGGTADGARAIKIGENGTANGENAIAIGKNAYANGLNSIAIGRGGAGDDDLSAPNANQINIGNQIKTGGGQSTRLSDWTGSLHATSTLIGRTDNNTSLVNPLGENNVQIGYNSRIVENSTRSNVTLVGANNEAAQGCIIVGNGTTGNGSDVIAIGNSLTVSSNNEISIGDKFKYDGSDTIQLNSTNLLFSNGGTMGSGTVGMNLGIEGGSVTGDYSAIVGATYSTLSAGDCQIFGGYNNTISAGARNLILGGENQSITGGDYSVILGGASNVLSAGDTSFIVGGYQNQVTAGGMRNGVIGGNASISNKDFSVVIGRQSYTTAAAYTTYVANLDVSGSTSIVDGAGATGSLVDNIHPTIASSSTQIGHIVTITQDQYTSISASAAVTDDTLYIISDASDAVYPDNLQVAGQIYSPTFAGTIASSTSSIDFDNGNFATLNAAAATFVANPTNLKSGTTYTVIVTNGANISGYGTAWKFAGGTEPTFSANTDILTCVSDGTSLYATGLADFS